jgi:hypothetical protein
MEQNRFDRTIVGGSIGAQRTYPRPATSYAREEVLAAMMATASWGIDNSLSREVAERDPSQVVMCKAAIGTALTTVLAWINGKFLPNLLSAAGLFTVGATGYGLSLRFYLLAQSAFGATRTGSVCASAPFIGALLAFAMGDRSSGVLMAAGGALMLLGVVFHLATCPLNKNSVGLEQVSVILRRSLHPALRGNARCRCAGGPAHR